MSRNGEEGQLLGDHLSDWLNSEEVRKALNIPNELPAYHGCMEDPEWEYHL